MEDFDLILKVRMKAADLDDASLTADSIVKALLRYGNMILIEQETVPAGTFH